MEFPVEKGNACDRLFENVRSDRNTTLTPAKGMHKGTSEAPVLSESKR